MTGGNLPRRSNPDGAFVLNTLRRVDPQPVPPWVYRKAKRGQSLDLSDLVPLENEPESRGSSRASPLLD
jgi:hypothetical protein